MISQFINKTKQGPYIEGILQKEKVQQHVDFFDEEKTFTPEYEKYTVRFCPSGHAREQATEIKQHISSKSLLSSMILSVDQVAVSHWHP